MIDNDFKNQMLRHLVGLPESKPAFGKMVEMADQIIARIPSDLVKKWQSMPGDEGWWATYYWLLDFFGVTNQDREALVDDAKHMLQDKAMRKMRRDLYT